MLFTHESQEKLQLVRCPLPLIEEIYTNRMIPLATIRKPLDVYIPREEGDLLYSIVRMLRPSLTVEVGMANGLSTLFITQALRDNGIGKHIAIDPFQKSEWNSIGLKLLQLAGLDSLVELIEKPSHCAIPELEQRGTVAQFIFIDGNHQFDYVMTDFLCADRILALGGLMAFDDSDWPSITQVLRYVLANRDYSVAYPEIVIEPSQIKPSFAARILRRFASIFPRIGAMLRPAFLIPNHTIGIRGRCVVLRKNGHDARNGQTTFHQAF